MLNTLTSEPQESISKEATKKVYIAVGATDMRKGIRGLSLLVATSFNLNPKEEAFFVFCSRKRDCIKILHWDRDGFWLHTKQLEKTKFVWPVNHQDAEVVELTKQELLHILHSPKIEQKMKGIHLPKELIF